MSAPASTLPEIVNSLARSRPDAVAIRWLRDGESDAVAISFAELDRRSSRIAAALRGRVAAGERVLILGDDAPEFIAAFLGCLSARMIAVPAAAPRANQSVASLESIVADCQPVAVISAGLKPSACKRLRSESSLQALRWIDLDLPLRASDEAAGLPESVDPKEIAYLQYTSGSTGLPRGVMITHENLIRNQQMMADVAGHGPATRYVGWLPLFHDMGLVGIALQSLYLGVPCVLFPPKYFLQKPLRWLSAISRTGATSSGAPDFAYELCTRTITPAQLATLDLSKWTVAISGGEPVRADTLERFAEKFRPCGFRAQSWLPCYGLAEATCLVTGPMHNRAPTVINFAPEPFARGDVCPLPAEEPTGRRLVGCGYPRLGEQLVIVDPDARTVCAENRIGEIWVRGPGVGVGYWGRSGETAATFGAMLDNGQGPFLRTGDLGFMHRGQLFIAGRLKDLIIIRGSNHHPHDIEQTVQGCNPAFAGLRGAAYGVELASQERLVIVQEVARTERAQLDFTEAIADIRQAVSAEHGVQPHAIILLRPASIPVTTSGKVRRRECRRRMEHGMEGVLAADYGQPDCRTAHA